MEKNIAEAERRQAPRYSIYDAGAVMLSPAEVISFDLIDISETGLAFLYNGPSHEHLIGTECIINFFGEDFCLDNILVTVVSDHHCKDAEIQGDTVIPQLRRCGVCFTDLTETQREVIVRYLGQLT